MSKIRSFDFALLGTSIFGVNQGFSDRFIGPRITWVLGIFNLCYSVTLTYLMVHGFKVKVDRVFFVNYNARKVFFYIALLTSIIIQIRSLLRRYKMTPFAQELYQLYQSSTWNGDVYGWIARIVFYLGWLILSQTLIDQAKGQKRKIDWRIIHILFYWSNFIPTVMAEFVGQLMLLLQHEFQVLCKITEGMIARKDYGIEELRTLNRRHASLFALSNKVARFTGIDSLLIIESERYLILLGILIQINLYMVLPVHWSQKLLDCGYYNYRIERITHHCFRGHKIVMEANRFASTLDEIDPLDFENDEFFTELQIFRKQVKLRKLQFNCNRFLKLDMKLILQISKDLFTMIIILVQLTTDSPTATAQLANATEADNVTEYFIGNSDIPSNSFTMGNN